MAAPTGSSGTLDAAAELLQGPVRSKGLCLLSLDGGGVRGLSTLIVLRYLMAKINSGLPMAERKKPHEIFDLIGGTSTGGLIAIMIGRLKMDVQECIDAYTSMFKEIFGKPIHKSKLTMGLQIQSKFDSTILRRCILKIVGASKALSKEDLGAIETAVATSSSASNKKMDSLVEVAAAKVLLDDGAKRGCRTFVCTTTFETERTVRFRDYPRPDLGSPNNITIVDAACATAAATSYFDAVTIGDRTYRDGAFGANNPVNEVWHEARAIWIKDDYEVNLDQILKCFVSIGTGVPKIEGMKEDIIGFLDTLKRMVTQTQRSADGFMESHRNLTRIDGSQRFFRFNVEQGLQDVGLEEYKKRPLVESATEGYMESPDRENVVALCARNMTHKTTSTGVDFAKEVKTYREGLERDRFEARVEASEAQKAPKPKDLWPPDLNIDILMGWLSFDKDYSSAHNIIRRKSIHAEAGQWMFADKNFQIWRKTPGSRLWLSGKMGCGKTILSSSLIESLITEEPETCPILYFYFSIASAERQKLSFFLVSIITQYCLIGGIPTVLQSLYAKYQKRHSPKLPALPIPADSELLKVFLKMCQTLPSGGYLIMDALDEIPHGYQRKELLRSLREISTQELSRLNIFVTSQSEPDFIDEFQWDLGWTSLVMGASRVDTDIATFVQYELSTAPKFRRLPTIDKDKIKGYLVERANGVFQWVTLILELLEIPMVLKPESIEEILPSLPKDLGHTYDRLLKRVDHSAAQEVAVALKWLALARRPLFIDEVIEAIAIDLSESRDPEIPMRFEQQRLRPDQLLSCLTGLVTLEPPLPVTGPKRHVLTLAHSSLLIYLKSSNPPSTAAFRFQFETSLVDASIAKCCVTYFTGCYFKSWQIDQYPLAHYSERYWSDHVGNDTQLLSSLREQVNRILSPLLHPESDDSIQKLLEASLGDCGDSHQLEMPKEPDTEERESNTGTLYKPLQGHEFRLILILPSKKWGDVPECRLLVVSLNDEPKYRALSYAWDPYELVPSEFIVVNGLRVPLQPNLFNCLQQISHGREGTHLIWVDILCINQHNNEEKHHQIRMMYTIYQNATRLWLWLGEGSDSSDMAMSYLSSFEDIPDSASSVKHRLLSMSDDIRDTIHSLLARPVFQKRWLIQELYVAREVEALCGSKIISGSILGRLSLLMDTQSAENCEGFSETARQLLGVISQQN